MTSARLNFSTRRLHIGWKGASVRANDFARAVADLGYTIAPFNPDAMIEGSEAENKFLLLCLGVAAFAMGNIMLLSVGLWITDAHDMGIAMRDFLHWVSGLIAIPAVMFSGRPFFRSALAALKKGRTNMDVPISVALILTSGMSLWETTRHGEHVFFDSAVMLMFFLLIGRYLDFRARRSARSTATDLLSSFSGFAHVLTPEGHLSDIPVRDVREDMAVRVMAGEKFPADGIILAGQTDIDTSLVTGESLPVAGGPQTRVFAGTVNLSAPVDVRVSKAADDSLLADIVRLMEKAGQGQALYVRIADRFARMYTPVVHILALGTFLVWTLGLGLVWQKSLMIAVTVLIITCPCALALAVPVVQVLATSRLMKAGILVKSGDALERLAGIDTVIFDKTGTLTCGKPQWINSADIQPLDLHAAASLAAHSGHVLARALAGHLKGEPIAFQSITEYPGQGLSAQFGGKQYRLGSRSYCGDVSAPPARNPEIWFSAEGKSPVCFIFADALRSDAAMAIQTLKAQGTEVHLLSGDRIDIVRDVAAQAGIAQAEGQKNPAEKFEYLSALKKQGRHVLMVGDGLNDAPVLAGADVSMSPSTAIDMAQNAADMVFMGEKLSPVLTACMVARLSQRLVKENFALAIIYNAIAIPMAMMGHVTPLIAALAMSGSSLVVIANSFRLRRVI